MSILKLSYGNSYLPKLFYHFSENEACIVVSKKFLLFVLNNLKLHSLFNYNILICASGIDLFGLSYRFCVSYELLSLCFNSRIRIKVFLNEFSSIPSASDIFVNSVWWEREIWDMFGIYFNNNLDLRRILTDYGFEGFPLRKDFPLSGFYGVTYSTISKLIVEEPLVLSQEYRNFLLTN